MLKWRYIRSFRMDTQYFLKILVIFNIFLGLYLLFLSTNNRRNTEYPHTHNDNDNEPNKIFNKVLLNNFQFENFNLNFIFLI